MRDGQCRQFTILGDGNSLSVWATVNGSREIPRSTINEVPLFGDEMARDIAFDCLRPAVVAKIARTRDSSIRLHPQILVNPSPILVRIQPKEDIVSRQSGAIETAKER
jgi:hypothetical protein